MKKSIKKLFPVIAGINGLLCTNLRGELAPLSAKDQAIPLSKDEQAAVDEMSQAISTVTKPIEEKVGNELLSANVRGDSKEPEKFKSSVKIELKRVIFDTDRLGTANKCNVIEVNLMAKTEDKNMKWTEPCKVKVYFGVENRRPDGKMLAFKSNCTCTTLPIDTEKSVFFFIPGDIRKKHNLPEIPQYCAVSFTIDGVTQPWKIVDKNGKDTYRSDGNTFHSETKKRSSIESRIMRNFDQMSGYNLPTGVIKNTPSLLLDIGA
jgi:hypothetical protein